MFVPVEWRGLIRYHSQTFTHTRNGSGRYLIWAVVRADPVPEVVGTHEQK